MTYFILNVLAPEAKDNSWCPKQIPKIGFAPGTRSFLIFSMVIWHMLGSPGPLLKNKPSNPKNIMIDN